VTLHRPASPPAVLPRAAACLARASRAVLAAALAAAWLAAAAPAPAQEAGPIDSHILDKRTQLQQLRFEREQMVQRMERARRTEAETLARIRELTRQVRDTRTRERRLQGRAAGLRNQRRAQDARLADLQAQVGEAQQRIGVRLRSLYRFYREGRTATLFALARYDSFLRDSQYLAVLLRHEQEAIRRYAALKGEVVQQQHQIDRTLAEVEQNRAALQAERARLAAQEKELAASLAELRENRTLYAKYLADLDQVMEGMQAALQRLEAEQRRRPPPGAVADPTSLRGKLPAPMAGTIVAAFGRHDPRYELKKLNRGIVIRVAPEQPVSATAAGKVVHAGRFRGYEDLVVIDHGKGLFTVYGHLQELAVRRGDWIAAGTRLGKATYQPLDQGYNVYFEVRFRGKPEDPEQWLQPGSLPVGGTAEEGAP